MPGTTLIDDIELIIEDIGGGGGDEPPDDGGDDGGDGKRGGRPGMPSSRRYATAIVLVMISIVMFFMGMSGAFIVLRATSNQWVPLHLPGIIWFNTAILLLSSGVVELARKRLALANLGRFRKLWTAATALGVLFLIGQLIAWWQMRSAGLYMATTQESSFFYVFTGLHGLHLFGGVAALLFVALRRFERANVSRAIAAQLASYYWHFMDGLWLFLLALLFFGK